MNAVRQQMQIGRELGRALVRPLPVGYRRLRFHEAGTLWPIILCGIGVSNSFIFVCCVVFCSSVVFEFENVFSIGLITSYRLWQR